MLKQQGLIYMKIVVNGSHDAAAVKPQSKNTKYYQVFHSVRKGSSFEHADENCCVTTVQYMYLIKM